MSKIASDTIGHSRQDFRFLNELGRGSFGTVYKVESLLDHKIYVIKKIDMSLMNNRHKKDALKEVQILRRLRHQNIIRYYTSFLEENCLNIVMEYASNGDLQKLIKQKKGLKTPFSEEEIWLIAKQLCEALIYLHENQIIHRDIKALNIFLDQDQRVKIGDLGVSKIVSNQFAAPGTRVGTPLYLAPELIKHQAYDHKIDIWALGCVLYYMTNFETPFAGENLITLGYNIVNKNPKQIPMGYSKKLCNFIGLMLEKDSSKRKGLKDLLDLIPIEEKNTKKEEILNHSIVVEHQNEQTQAIINSPPKHTESKIITVIESPKICKNNEKKEEINVPIDKIKKEKTQKKKFKIRPMSANISKSQQQEEIQLKVVKENEGEKHLMQEIKKPILYRPRSAFIQKKTNLIEEKTIKPIQKEIEIIQKEKKTLEIIKDVICEPISFRPVTPDIKECYVPIKSNFIDEDENDDNNESKNFFFQVFGIKKQIHSFEQKNKFMFMSSSTIGFAKTNRLKDENNFTQSTCKIVKAFPLDKAEPLCKKGVSFLNLKHMFKNKNEEKNPDKHIKQTYSNNKSKTKFTLKDLE